MNESVVNGLKKILGSDSVFQNEDMGKHTTFRVGGCADIFVNVHSIGEAAETVRLLLANGCEFEVIGNGSNLLVSDSGYRGCIVCMQNTDISVDHETITSGAGALLSKAANLAFENSLGGMEFASGIPGSVGGAVVMNAGAYGGEVKDIISSVTVFDTSSGNIRTLKNEEMQFGYRTSIVKKEPLIVLEAQFKLPVKEKDRIKELMDELAQKRREKQPLEFPSAGSTFKRPEGYFAAKLIEDAGLKGYCIGGAQVSEKHSGFVINKGGATASDVTALIRDVRKKVYEDSKVMLEPEVVILGEDISI